MAEEYVRPDLVKSAFKSAVRSLFGENGSRVLELHLRRFLGRDPYEVLYEDPRCFCDGLRSIFGPGARGILLILARTLIRDNGVQGLTPEQILELFESDDRELQTHLFAILCSSHRRSRGAAA